MMPPSPVHPITHWYAAEGRKLPWRETKDPYRIWLSEIILQQTRIDQGTSYYHKFIRLFPTVFDLAEADSEVVMKAWEGLGYYSRARNLHHTAKVVATELNGIFPDDYRELMKLKGIGPYTARAVGSIAFGNRTGVLDGNVFRVLSRYLGDFSPIDLPTTRKSFQTILDGWLNQGDPADFNQGMMDLGSMVCTAQKPACGLCPLQPSCVAVREGFAEQLPVKEKKLKRRRVWLHFYLVNNAQGDWLIRKRPPEGIWGDLWEVPNREVEEKVWNRADEDGLRPEGAFKHVLTHLDLMIKVYRASEFPGDPGTDAKWVAGKELAAYAFSRAVLKIFERYLPEIV